MSVANQLKDQVGIESVFVIYVMKACFKFMSVTGQLKYGWSKNDKPDITHNGKSNTVIYTHAY